MKSFELAIRSFGVMCRGETTCVPAFSIMLNLPYDTKNGSNWRVLCTMSATGHREFASIAS